METHSDMDRLGNEIAELSAHLEAATVVRGRLTPEAGTLLLRALDAARETLHQRARVAETAHADVQNVSAETPTMPQWQADALALLAETALHHGIDPGTPGERYQVVVHVDAGVLADADHPGQSVLEGGTRVSADTSQRLACDASRVVCARTLRAESSRWAPERGRSRRRFGGRYTVATAAADFPAVGCASLRAITSAIGRGAVRRSSLTFRRPGGWIIPEVPPTPTLPGDSMEALMDENITLGLCPGPHTMTPDWHGERLDVGYAIDVLHPLALAAGPAGRLDDALNEPLGVPDAQLSGD